MKLNLISLTAARVGLAVVFLLVTTFAPNVPGADNREAQLRLLQQKRALQQEQKTASELSRLKNRQRDEAKRKKLAKLKIQHAARFKAQQAANRNRQRLSPLTAKSTLPESALPASVPQNLDPLLMIPIEP